MSEIFGISMNIILIILLAIMGICLLSVAFVAVFNRVVFKMALRNPRRRKTQSILIIFGLMLATLITSAALTTGDTLDHSIKSATYEGLGQVDEAVVFSTQQDGDGNVNGNDTLIPSSLAGDLEQEFANDPDIDAFLPVLSVDVPALNAEQRLSEPDTSLTGVDVSRLEKFGGIQQADGGTVDIKILQDGNVIISKTLAEDTSTSVGDQITVFVNNQQYSFPVGAIGADSVLTGNPHGIALPIERVQEMTGDTGMASLIAVSNTGGIEGGLDHASAAEAKLKSALAGQQLGVDPLKDDLVAQAGLIGSIFTSLFIVLGLFSIAAGVLLIFLIFMMLAAERRSEMGMARAVGMRQSSLVQQFLSEGTLYDLGAALVGAVLGIGVSFIMLQVMTKILGDELDLSFHFTLRSLAVAYSLGVTVTFLTIIFASARAARLNIVSAIRDLPDVESGRNARPRWIWWRKIPRFGPKIPGIGMYVISLLFFPVEAIPNLFIYPIRLIVWLVRTLAHYTGWGPLLTPVGALMMLWGWSLAGESWSLALYSVGLSLLGFGIMLILRHWLPQRPVFTAVSLFMLLWWLAGDSSTFLGKLFDPITPNNLQGDFEMFFISGIMMVTYATLLIMWNAEVIVWIVATFGKLFARWLPAVKTAVAYPLASKTKTGLTLAMFGLIVFSLVTMSTLNANFIEIFTTDQADGGWDVQVTLNKNNPLGDLTQELDQQNVDTSGITAVGSVSQILQTDDKSGIRLAGNEKWKEATIDGVDPNFAQDTVMPLKDRAIGYADDQAVWNAIGNGEPVAVVDALTAAGNTGDFGPTANSFKLPDLGDNPEGFQPVDVEMTNLNTGSTETVKVIGVIDDKVSTALGVYLNQSYTQKLFDTPDVNLRLVQLNDSSLDNTKEFARTTESALLERGVQADSIQDEVRKAASQNTGFLNLIQGFMGLGLLVGIAALGVVSFRAVVERRQQIGMLRAIGFQKNMVAATFLIESMVVAVLGILSGLTLGLILSYNLISSDDFTEGASLDRFIIPWGQLSIMMAIAIIAAAVMTIIPSRNAASVPVADALRYE